MTDFDGDGPALPRARAALKRMVDHPQRDKVWFTRPGEIADYVKALPAGTVAGS
jgi:allantoinase